MPLLDLANPLAFRLMYVHKEQRIVGDPSLLFALVRLFDLEVESLLGVETVEFPQLLDLADDLLSVRVPASQRRSKTI